MTDDTSDPTDRSPSDAPKHFVLRLDDATRRALSKLKSDGTTVTEAVRKAIIEAAEKETEQRRVDTTDWPVESFQEQIKRNVASAPRASPCQVYLVRETLHKGYAPVMCDALDGPRHKQLTECRAPECAWEDAETQDI